MKNPKVKKLALVFPPLKEWYKQSARSYVMPMRGLPRICTYLQNRHLAEIILYDGIVSIPDREKILDRMIKETPDIVGFYTNVINYPIALEMAKKLKESCNPKIIFGGPWVSLEGVATKTLLRRKYVDFVCVGQGEPTLEGLLSNCAFSSIPNLVWGDEDDIVHNFAKNTPLSKIPKPNMGFLDIELYKQLASKMGLEPCITLQAFSGCTRKCTFCIRETKRIDAVSPLEYLSEIESLYERFGVNHFWDISATFTSNSRWIEEFAGIMREKSNKFKISAYARINEITPKKTDLLIECGVTELFIGFESGDDDILRRIKKDTTIKKAIEATKILSAKGIKILGAFITGLPGENLDSLKKTYDFASRIYENGKGTMIYSSVIMPFPGSIIYGDLLDRLKKEISQRVQGAEEETERITSDVIDPRQLRQSWSKRFCSVSIEAIEEYAERIAAISGLSTSFIDYKEPCGQNGVS